MTFAVPPEWAPHRAMWLGFPSHAELWEENLEPARREVAGLVRALAGPGREHVRLMVHGDDGVKSAARLLKGVAGVEIVAGQFGDIWIRDTGPIFLAGSARAAAFRVNGWGGKYVLEGDDAVADQIAAAAGAVLERHDLVMEGGSIDHDGLGTVLTTGQCLLNPNRNPGMTEAIAEAALASSLGARKVLWLGDGLLDDHTDGHVDNLARFVAPGVVVCPMAYGRDDPNTEIYDAAAAALGGMTDADGRKLRVVRVPSPGRILDAGGEVVPASHMNFLIANGAVVTPVYEDVASGYALDALRSVFPDRQVIGLPARAILTGGGSFHCISQQEPA